MSDREWGPAEPAEVTLVNAFGARAVGRDGTEAPIVMQELGYGRIRDPRDVLSIGDSIEVCRKVEEGRTFFSRRAALPDPLASFRERTAAGTVVQGEVVGLQLVGPERWQIVVELEPGVEGIAFAAGPANPPWAFGERLDFVVTGVVARNVQLTLR